MTNSTDPGFPYNQSLRVTLATGASPMTKETRTEKQCVVCQAEFLSSKKQQVYCSYDCYLKSAATRNSAYYAALKKAKVPVSKVCPTCHNQFETLKLRMKYCSNNCYQEERLQKCRDYMQKVRDDYKKAHPKDYKKECELCGKSYDYRTKQGRYCEDCGPLARKIFRGQGSPVLPS